MPKAPNELLALKAGAWSVGENINRAIESGQLIEGEDGSLRHAANRQPRLSWMRVSHGPPLACDFLMHFMFDHAYAQSAVPHGCSACYKVKVMPRTLRELVAAWQLGKRVNCRSKWGTDLNNPYSQNIYAGYFYVSGLDAARALFKVVRQAFDQDAKLGPDIPMSIKRGCSEYEAKLGPSDRYKFTPEMAELEASLKQRYRERGSNYQPALIVAHWIETAFRIGDETYLDFTGGKRLRPKMVSYDPA